VLGTSDRPDAGPKRGGHHTILDILDRTGMIQIEFDPSLRMDGRVSTQPIGEATLGYGAIRNRKDRRNRLRPGAHPGTQEPGIAVARVLEPCNPTRGKPDPQGSPSQRQQRPKYAHMPAFGDRRHAGKPDRTARPCRAHGDGFPLIIGMVPEQQVEHTVLGARQFQQVIPGSARSRLDGAARLVAAPSKDSMLDAEHRASGRHLRGFGRRTCPQSMVNGQRQDRPTSPPRPMRRQVQQGGRIGSTGQPDGKQGFRLEGSSGAHRRRECAFGIRTCQHPIR
jgi:hypothetical protein